MCGPAKDNDTPNRHVGIPFLPACQPLGQRLFGMLLQVQPLHARQLGDRVIAPSMDGDELDAAA